MLRNQQKSGLCLPRIAALIDWSVVPDAVSGPLRTDKLVPVRLRDGIEQWLLIHSAGMRRTSFGRTGSGGIRCHCSWPASVGCWSSPRARSARLRWPWGPWGSVFWGIGSGLG